MSTACQTLVEGAAQGVAPALRAVDCLSNEAAAAAFGRLFGGQGALLPALTILLTLYIAFFAISLLTGRSRIGVAALTPRMMTLGVVLTFATSWVAYQGVVWNLAVGGPDQIAAVLTGAKGSATQIFADRIDLVFNAIAEVAGQSGSPEGAASTAASGTFSPTSLMWLGALLLLLGTVGVLLTSRIALGVLLAVGPVFVVFALFPGTRGLCAGWLRGVVLTAITPLFVVTGGSLTLELLIPAINGLQSAEGIDGRAALALFLIAAVHVALMVMVTKVAGTMVAGWTVFGLGVPSSASGGPLTVIAGTDAGSGQLLSTGTAVPAASGQRASPVTAAMTTPAALATGLPATSSSSSSSRTVITTVPGAESSVGSLPRQRGRGIGSRFQSTSGNPSSLSRPREFLR